MPGIEKLKEGLHKFLHNVHASERELFEQLGRGQAPRVLFITCADSRIAPSLITQTKPGELFVLRNVANIVPPASADEESEAAVVEYAVSALKVDDVIVCGHTQCGGIQAVLDPSKVAELPAVRGWLRHAASLDPDELVELQGEERLMAAVEHNVITQLSNLHTHPAIASAMDAGRLNLHGWVYDVGAGNVTAFDSDRDAFVPISGDGSQASS